MLTAEDVFYLVQSVLELPPGAQLHGTRQDVSVFNGLNLAGVPQTPDVHDGNADHSGDKNHGRQAGKGCRAVPAQEFSHAVDWPGPPGQDRLVVEVTLDVLGQGMGRLIATHPVLLHGLDRDPVEIPV